MLTVMLCGAADTADVLPEFQELAARMGFEPWSFLDGTIRYRNAATSGWRENSRASVQEADVVVFVIVEEFGAIALTEELSEALAARLPLLVLCDDSSLDALRDWQRSPAGTPTTSLLAALDRIERELQVTIIPFERGRFSVTLQQHLSLLLQQAARALRAANERATQRLLVSIRRDLTDEELNRVQKIAIDETEDKYLRKRAIDVLVRTRGIPGDVLLELVASMEQGVARKALTILPEVAGNYGIDVFDSLADLVNETDDVGMDRRLINAVLELRLDVALHTLSRLRISEVGSARRVLHGLITRDDVEPALLSASTIEQIDLLISRCLDYRQAGGGLTTMATELRGRLGVA